MAKKSALVIVESPTKAKTISKYLGSEYSVKATVGHVRDLPQRELGVDVEKGFKPKYVTIKGKSKTLAELKKAASTSTDVYIATDPDREGEAIAWHVASQLKTEGQIHRVLFHEITKTAVAEAMSTPVVLDDHKVDAQQARRILDRIVGYKLSPLLWKSIKTGLSAGRVQTVALRIIVEREAAIRAFKPEEYWSVEVDLNAKKKDFEAKLLKVKGKKPKLENEKATMKVVDAVKGKPFIVSSVTRKERRRNPAAPFTTSTMQQEAAKRHGFASSRTMQVAQQLYEGIELGSEGAVGLITYMRTDSVRVSDTAIDAARDFVRSKHGDDYLPAKPNVYSSKKKSKVQDAHEAVRPSEPSRTPESVKAFLSPEQLKLYRLIWQRFVASQMNPAVYDTTTIDFLVEEDYLFRATGSVVKFDGYHAIYHEAKEEEEEATLDDMSPVPALDKGDEAKVKEIKPNQHFTDPPPRFSEASLVKELEGQGIGRPSTYSSIIKTLKDRQYVELLQKRFHATELGETVSRVMVRRFPDIFNVEFTSGMELELDKVEEGEIGWKDVLSNFYHPFKKTLDEIDTADLIRDAHDVGEIEKEVCEKCGTGKMTVKSGRYGPFIACSNYPTCKFTRQLKKDKQPDQPTDEKCEKCQSAMVIKSGRFGQFLACTKYPECKHTQSISLGVKCPTCAKGDLTERRTKRGRSFYGCTKYPDCDFSTWNRPVPDPCPECKFEGSEFRSTKAKGEYRICLKCSHEFTVEASTASE